MAERIDEEKLINLISDIQSRQAELEKATAEHDEAVKSLQDAEDYLADVKVDLHRMRDELESYLDEVIPETEISSDRSW